MSFGVRQWGALAQTNPSPDYGEACGPLRATSQVYEPGVRPIGPVITRWSDYSGTDPDPVAAAYFYAYNQSPLPPTIPDNGRYETWLSRVLIDCSLDANGDGTTDLFDLGSFEAMFVSGASRSDYRADGVLTVDDLIAYTIDLIGPP